MRISYSDKIAEAIHTHLRENEFKYNFNAERGAFDFIMGTGGMTKALIYHLLVHENGFTSSARCLLGPMGGDEACLTTMAKYLTRVNYGLRNGNFEMDMDDGEINYKSYFCCRGLEAPTDEMVMEAIQCAAAMFDKYEAGILGILFNGMTDKEAYEHSERSTGSLLAHLEAELEKRGIPVSDEDESVVVEENDEDDGVPFSFEEFMRFLARQEAEKNDRDIVDAE